MEEFDRIRRMFGDKGMQMLKNARVLIFGLGGVGSYCLEALCRSGIGMFVLVDHDHIALSNINRQIGALHSTVGRSKTEVYRERALDINPLCALETHQEFVAQENIAGFFKERYDYVIDAIDTSDSKAAIIQAARSREIPIISSMGMANRYDPKLIRIADISQTMGCALARKMRQKLKSMGIHSGVKTVFSTEKAQDTTILGNVAHLGSVAYVPSVAGLYIAAEIVNSIVKSEDQ